MEKAGKIAVFHTVFIPAEPSQSPQATERVRPIKNAGQSLQDCPALLYSLHHIVKYQLCDLEIQDQAAGVHDGGDEGGSHDGRVCTQLLCGQRQHTAHQLCQNDAEEQRHADHDGIARHVGVLAGEEEGVHQVDAQAIHDAQHCAHDGRHPQLLAQHPHKVGRLYLAQSQTAHHQGADLVAAVTGGIHQHGHKGDQQRQRGKGFLIVGGDHAGKGGRKHQDQQPWDALLCVGPDAGAKVGGGIVTYLFSLIIFFY